MTPPAAAVAEPLPRRGHSTKRAPVRHPRRVSGPAAPARTAQPRRDRVESGAETHGLALRAIDAYERVTDSTLLDRLVRGRLWIGLLAFGLIGIVAMQLVVLELNTGIGATLVRAAGLQRANAQLRIEAATGSGEGRIEPLAAATGMTFAPSGSVHFVTSTAAADVARAAQVLSQPIQPHESAPSSSEAAGAGSESQENAAAAPTAAGEANTAEPVSQSGEASGSASGSSEASTPSESHSGENSPATTSEAEASAAAAGGVAAGH